MAIKLIGTKKLPNVIGDGECEVLTAKEFLCDTDADFASLPECCVSSSAVSIESGKVYVVNTSGQWVEFAPAPGAEPEKKFKTIAYDPSMGAVEFCVMAAQQGMTAVDEAVLPTKTTEDINLSDVNTGELYLYYIEDEDDIFVCGMERDGNYVWASFGEFTGGELSYLGTIEDISEATETGYYALIYYGEEA